MSLRTAWQRVSRGSGNTIRSSETPEQAPKEAFVLCAAEEELPWSGLCFRLPAEDELLEGFFEKQAVFTSHASRLSSDLTDVIDVFLARKELSILNESVELAVALQARHANDMVGFSRRNASLPPSRLLLPLRSNLHSNEELVK
ncbi:unnamed protein product [Calypogeia fissa]